MKVTVLKPYRKTETINRVELSEAVAKLQQGEHATAVNQLRSMYHLMRIQRNDDGSVDTNIDSGSIRLPRICFSADFEKRKNELHLLQYNGLVVLEVNNLASQDEAVALRKAAQRLPQTMLAFVGASGRSVKIVCRGELYPDQQKGRPLPTAHGEIIQFHQNLYEMARKAYCAQLDTTIEGITTRVDRTVYLSADADLWWNADALPFYTDSHRGERHPAGAEGRQRRGKQEDKTLLPGRSQTKTHQMNFLFIMERVLGHYFDLPTEKRLGELLMELATYCLEEQIPMGMAQSLTLRHPVFCSDELLVKKTFQTVYSVEQIKKYQERNRFRPMKSIPEDTLLLMKTEAFLHANFDMRKNVMTGVAQYREKDGYTVDFEDLDQEARNDMTIRAKEMGLKSWDKDIDRFIDSTRIEKYDPVNDYLDHLPRWDGQDRIAALAARIPTNQPHWEQYLRTWLLGMVAHWMGRSTLTGNALVPLLIGRQGCGKSSFCRILLPHTLRLYYNDRISFKNETDLNLGLTSFALINIDEFDKVTQRQQVLLKYLLSTADVKFRPPYGKAVKQYRRYASFIGTTNDMKPLTDPTGSRRFVCCEVTGDIDFSDTLNHAQLYAQLRQLVQSGERYWLNDEETQVLIAENERFQRINALEEMVGETFRRAENNEEGRWWSLTEVSDKLKDRYRNREVQNIALSTLGQVMNYPRFRFDSKRRSQGMIYRLVEQ